MILQAKKLSKTFAFQKPLFKDLDLELKAGQSIAIQGRSGEGKTTLLHILGTLEAPDSGEIWIQNKLISLSNGAWIRNQSIGFIFQAFHLLEDFTALENVLIPAKIARKQTSLEYGLHLLNLVGLADKAGLKAKLLSGGEKQRVAIARAFCNNPSLIIADEPSGNLDQANADILGNLLMGLVEKENKGLILATHDPILAKLCQMRYVLSSGSLSEI